MIHDTNFWQNDTLPIHDIDYFAYAYIYWVLICMHASYILYMHIYIFFGVGGGDLKEDVLYGIYPLVACLCM